MTTKERRALAASLGFCATCRKRRPSPGYRTCEHCLHGIARIQVSGRSRHQTAEQQQAASHICCQSHGTHRFDCPESPVRGHGPYLRRAA